jgi:hypothetical protein
MIEEVISLDEDEFARDLGALGYPGFSHLKGGHKKNPAELLISGLCSNNLDIRIVEALPWLAYRFPNLDWEWHIKVAITKNIQNRLGFVISLARQIAEFVGETDLVSLLKKQELLLGHSRLMNEDTLCHDSLTKPERNWIFDHRTEEARYWRLITDLRMEHLHYVDH